MQSFIQNKKIRLFIQLIPNDQTILSGVLLTPIGWVFSTSVDRMLDDGVWTSIAVVLISPKGALVSEVVQWIFDGFM